MSRDLPAWAILPGLQVHVSSALPLVPSDGENARRLVRHLYASTRVQRLEAMYFPDSLGDVGPAPGAETHAIITKATEWTRGADGIHVSRDLWRRLQDQPEDLLKHISREDLYRS